jgi:polyisoprenyl-teichoic acid--peptidoglycan teichoic acid transferase
MNNFRNDPSNRRQARRAIDGFINTPPKGSMGPGVQSKRLSGSRPPVFSDRLRSDIGGRVRATDGFSTPKISTTTRPAASTQKTSVQKEAPLRQQFNAHQKKDKRRFGFRKNRTKKQRPTWKKWAIRGSLATFVVVFVLVGLLAAKGYLRLNQVLKGGGAAAALDSEVDPTKLKGEGDGRINILLLGRGGEGHDGPDLTDTLLVASIDPVNKKSVLISVPRDLWVKTAAGSSKINAVFANAKERALNKGQNDDAAEKAGIDAIEGEIEEVLDVNMHYYAIVDFKGFEQAVNTVGGVTINVPEELRDPTMAWENNWNPVLAKAGVQQMNGKQALMYVRSRHGSARGDFDRSERQRLFIMALKDKIMSSGTYSNPVKISKLMDDFGTHAKTDFSMTDLLRLYSITKGVKDTNIQSIGLVDPPHDYLTTDNYAGQSIVVPKSGTFDYSDIHSYIRSQLPDGYVLKENAPITVLNGTTSEGIATQEADELKSYSYNVKKVDNAPSQDYQKTVIVDLTGKNKYTKNYLEKRFDTKVTRTLPQGITIPEQERKGFVIIIGSNETINR